jgi:hypothetical protein
VVVDNANSTVVIEATFDFWSDPSGTAATYVGFLNWNTADQTRQAIFICSAAGNRASVGQNWRITGVAAGSYVAKLRASCTVSNGHNLCESPHTSLSVQVIS